MQMQMQTSKAGLYVKILCTIGGTSSLVYDLNVKVRKSCLKCLKNHNFSAHFRV